MIKFQVVNGLIDEGDLERLLRKDPNMRFLNDFDPMETIRDIRQPVLIISGARDRRVPASDALVIANESRKKGNENVSVHVLPEYNPFY